MTLDQRILTDDQDSQGNNSYYSIYTATYLSDFRFFNMLFNGFEASESLIKDLGKCPISINQFKTRGWTERANLLFVRHKVMTNC